MARVSQAQEARVHWRSMRKRPRQEVEKQRGGWNLEVDARGAWRPSDWTDPLAILPGRLVYGLELGPFCPFNFPRPASAANLPFRSLTPPPPPRDRIPEHCSTNSFYCSDLSTAEHPVPPRSDPSSPPPVCRAASTRRVLESLRILACLRVNLDFPPVRFAGSACR